LILTSVEYSAESGVPGFTLGPPPCNLRARIVATRTTQLGTKFEYRHFMLKNFSIPISAPKPASVTTKPSFPTSFNAILSATIEEFPCARLN